MNTNKDETLFWSVYRNKFLNFKIFKHIETVERVEYFKNKNVFPSMSKESRIKFKHIYDFNWMVKNKQYQLLKCKLSNKDEYIEINDHSIWIKLISNDIDSSSATSKSTLTSSTSSTATTTTTTTIDLKLFKEIIKLLFNRFKEEFKSNLNEIIIELLSHSSIKVINILFKQFGMSLESLISNSYTQLDQDEQEGHSFQDYLNCVFKNKNHCSQLLEYISKLVISHQHNQNDQPQQQFKLKINKLFLIGSSDLQNELLDLNLIDKKDLQNEPMEIPFYIKRALDKKDNQMITNSLLLSIRLLKIKDNLNQSKEIHMKQENENEDEISILGQLFKELLILSKSSTIYEFYLKELDQVVSESLNIMPLSNKAVHYCLDNLSINVLKELKIENINQFFSNFNGFLMAKVYGVITNLNEFLVLYLSIISTSATEIPLKLFKHTIHLILFTMFRIGDKETYKSMYDIIPDEFKVYIPNEWNSIQLEFGDDEKLIVQDIETANWIKECNDKLKLPNTYNFSMYCKNINYIGYESFELAKYAYESNQIISNKYYIENTLSDYYYYPFVKAIKQCDLIQIQLFNSMNLKFKDLKLYLFFKKQLQQDHKFNSNCTESDYNLLFNFIIENEMIIGLYNSLKFIQIIVENGYYQFSDNDYIDINDNCNSLNSFFNLSNIKINFNKSNENQDNFSQFENIKLTRFLLENSFYYKSISTMTNEFSLIKLFIGILNNNINNNIKNDFNNGEITNLELYYTLINIIFGNAILSIGKNYNDYNLMDNLKSIYKLLKDNSIPIKIENIKSWMELFYPIFYLYLYGDGDKSVKSRNLSIDAINNSNYDQLLDIIVTDIYQYKITDYQEFSLNKNCYLFLKSNRLDLFFSQLSLIKNQHNLLDYLIEPFCKIINEDGIDNTDSIIKFINYGNNEYNNINYLILMASTFLKFDKLNCFIIIFNYLKCNWLDEFNYDYQDYSRFDLISIFNTILKDSDTNNNNFTITKQQ